MKKFFKGLGIGAIIILIGYVLSWLLTCGIIKLITLCFGLGFSWLVATGIWLVLCLITSVFRFSCD